jgi:hypothetical protein
MVSIYRSIDEENKPVKYYLNFPDNTFFKETMMLETLAGQYFNLLMELYPDMQKPIYDSELPEKDKYGNLLDQVTDNERLKFELEIRKIVSNRLDVLKDIFEFFVGNKL